MQARANSALPEGGPLNRGLPLDDKLVGYKSYAKPVDDVSTGEIEDKDEPPERVTGPRDMTKSRDRIDIDDKGGDTGFMGLGPSDASPKTKYPYRTGIPTTHNASFIVELFRLGSAPEFRLRTAATLDTLVDGLNPKTVERAKKCQVDLRRVDTKNLRWIFSVDCGNGPKVVKLKAAKRGRSTKFRLQDFHVACSCPAWRWQGPEYHSTTRDFQDPRTPLQGTATPPDIRDPQRINMICKHVAAVLSFTKQWLLPGKSKSKGK